MWTALAVVLAVLLVCLWIFVLVDVWRRQDLTTTAKVVWTAVIVLLPYLGTVVYLIVGFFLRDALAEE
jgi:hypothetical protein